MITVSAFRWVPTFARGLVRDLRVRWALEEAGLPYKAWLIGPDDQKSERYRAMQPFGQVPAYEEDDLVLFESGAILLHIADRSEVLMPLDSKARARVTAWMFAALIRSNRTFRTSRRSTCFMPRRIGQKNAGQRLSNSHKRVWPRSPIGSTVATIWRIVSPWRTF